MTTVNDFVALEADHDRLCAAVRKFLDGRMAAFNDSRTVDDDLVALAKALNDAEYHT